MRNAPCGVAVSGGYASCTSCWYRPDDGVRTGQPFRSLINDEGPAYDRLEAERAALAARPDCTGKVGIMGFCLGGRFALVAAGRGMFAAAAVQYGLLPEGKQPAGVGLESALG